MATDPRQRKKKTSIFPDFPRHHKVVEQDGHFTPTWHLSLASLYKALQSVFSNEGYLIPPLSIDDQNTILAIYTNLIGKTLQSTNPPTPNISGQMIYSIGSGNLILPPDPPDPGYIAPVPKMFIIGFAKATDPTSVIKTASWKTFTVT